MKTVKKRQEKSNGQSRVKATMEIIENGYKGDCRIELIQQLIPLGLMAVEEELQSEVTRLAGDSDQHDANTIKRWGSNPGSVCLGSQKLAILVPRVRDPTTGKAVFLKSYRAFQSPRAINDHALAQVMNGISTRKFEKAATQIPSAFGIKKSQISNQFIQASAKRLETFQNRELSALDIRVIFMDGKRFAEHEMIIALGVTLQGEKVILGAIEAGTENESVVRDFLNQLKDRGLKSDHKILFVIDGAKGLRKGIASVFGSQAMIQRCQWHKRENVVAYLPKAEQDRFRKKLQKAYHQNDYRTAKKQLSAIRNELKLINESAVRRLDEGLEETLTLQRLGLFASLGISLKTTNCIESVNSPLEQYTRRVTYWKNSHQRQRWVATALLEIEPTLRKIEGYRFLPALRVNMENFNIENREADAA